MPSPTTLQSQALARPGRNMRQNGEGEGPGKKPKKVNSEIRKQQNRIASRNYREKRKRKLQYLQQLIKDGSSDQQEPEAEPSPERHKAYARSLSVDYETPGPSSSSYLLASSSDFGSITSSSTVENDPTLVASGASFENRPLASTQAYAAFGPSWNAPLYTPSPAVNLSPWDFSPWIPSLNHTPQISSRSEILQYNTPSGPPVFAQAHPPSQQPRDLTPRTDYYAFGSSYGAYSQASGIPNYFFGQQAFAFDRSVHI
ncbi:hypothetical protein BKA66DRAFT_417999 [Pyrenochaeta sp. MPI-SDFR-AT-0127]|nr:hypothetical protein BKA66DRAFT_417999 [Pyrenochaeta sp. MPI-SDFR-AT-0127]